VADLFEERAGYFESLIHQQRIREVSKLVMQRQALPSKTDLLARYQTALDNDLYKALKALREAQPGGNPKLCSPCRRPRWRRRRRMKELWWSICMFCSST